MRPPHQCWSLFPALWSFRVWSTLCKGEGGGGTFYLGLGCSKIRQKRSSVSLLLKPIVGANLRRDATSRLQFLNQSVLADFDDRKKTTGFLSLKRLVAFQARVIIITSNTDSWRSHRFVTSLYRPQLPLARAKPSIRLDGIHVLLSY